MPSDEHYWKYRVFHEPSAHEDIGHPVPIYACHQVEPDNEDLEDWATVKEVQGSFFVLRPENDHHARVAMAAYAYSCRKELPHLAADLIGMIESLEWEEETGQHRDDLPVTSEDRMDASGDQLNEATISYLRDKKEETK